MYPMTKWSSSLPDFARCSRVPGSSLLYHKVALKCVRAGCRCISRVSFILATRPFKPGKRCCLQDVLAQIFCTVGAHLG